MSRPARKTVEAIRQRRIASGLGTGCVEAQADGVPCEELRRDCENCERAASPLRPAKGTRKVSVKAPA